MADYKDYYDFKEDSVPVVANRGISYPRPTTIPSKGPRIKSYTTMPDPVKAIFLDTVEAMEEAARWCGGEVRSEQFHDGEDKALFYPTLSGAGTARIGTYFIHRRDTGRYSAMSQAEFEKLYHEVGLRQDGIAYRGLSPDEVMSTS